MHEQRVPPVKPCQKFYLLGLTARADVTGVGPVRLRRKTGLRLVKRQVVQAALDPEDRKRAGDDLGDWRPPALLKRNLCGRVGYKRQAVRLDKARDFIFPLDRCLVCTVLEFPQETGVQADEVTLEI